MLDFVPCNLIESPQLQVAYRGANHIFALLLKKCGFSVTDVVGLLLLEFDLGVALELVCKSSTV